MNRFKKLAAPVAGIALVAAGLASAAATDPIPNPLPNAVAGNVIKATDINDIATAVSILDERTGYFNYESNGNIDIGANLNVSGSAIIPAVDEAGTSILGLGLDYSVTPGSGPRKINLYPDSLVDGAGFAAASGAVEYYTNGSHVFYSRPNRASIADEYISTQLMILNPAIFRINHLSGTGNAYACIDASGTLYRSATACN